MQKDVQLRLSPQRASDEKNIRHALGLSESDRYVIVRKSVDARRHDVMIDLVCRINPDSTVLSKMNLRDVKSSMGSVVVVGSGPAGLFAAMTLLEYGIKPVVLERGRDVHTRKRDIALISTKGTVDPVSNYSFGEGGAGTYSDGKLFTRSKKRGDNEKVLGTFVQFGAPECILYESHPHIGTDKLPAIIENMRNAIIRSGGEVHFETRMTSLKIKDGVCIGAEAYDASEARTLFFEGPVILATGNAARDTFSYLAETKIAIEPKDISVGVRLEHPQQIIDCMQYHSSNGRGLYLPAAEYSFATQVNKTGVYSFCMCPGGFVVPAASDSEQVVVNGMSPSTRGSVWANSGMVVQCPVSLAGDENDPLCVVRFQEEIERRTFKVASGTQKAPAQRMTDFIAEKQSSSLPRSSYAPGLTPCVIDNVLPPEIVTPLRRALVIFSSQAHGFLTEDAVLIGSETRTSSPVKIIRDPVSLESVSVRFLFPCGEGAGYAGGIVSAAVDGIRCAERVAGIITAEKNNGVLL